MFYTETPVSQFLSFSGTVRIQLGHCYEALWRFDSLMTGWHHRGGIIRVGYNMMTVRFCTDWTSQLWSQRPLVSQSTGLNEEPHATAHCCLLQQKIFHKNPAVTRCFASRVKPQEEEEEEEKAVLSVSPKKSPANYATCSCLLMLLLGLLSVSLVVSFLMLLTQCKIITKVSPGQWCVWNVLLHDWKEVRQAKKRKAAKSIILETKAKVCCEVSSHAKHNVPTINTAYRESWS